MQLDLLYKNIIANYAAVVWIALINLLTLPFYYRLLGNESWSILSVYIAAQSVFAILDAGLLQIMSKTVAGMAAEKQNPYRSYIEFSRIYSKIALVSVVIVAGLSPVIWHVFNGRTELLLALCFQIFFQLKNNCNTGYWSGTQQQQLANIRQCSFITLKHAVFIAICLFIKPLPLFYALVFSTLTATEYFLNRALIIQPAELADGTEQQGKSLYQVRAMSVAILSGAFVSQADKLILPAMVTAQQFGQYLLIANFALALFNLQYPVLKAFIPHQMSGINEAANDKKLFCTLSLFCALPGLIAILFSRFICEKLLGTTDIAEYLLLSFRLIILAVIINGYYNIFYSKMIRRSAHRIILLTNLTNCCMVAAVVYFSSAYFNILGGAMGWLCASTIQIVIALAWLYIKNTDKY